MCSDFHKNVTSILFELKQPPKIFRVNFKKNILTSIEKKYLNVLEFEEIAPH